jgi:hypothetical protein
LENLRKVLNIKLYVPTAERKKWMGTTNIPIETIDNELEIHEIRQCMMKDNLLFNYQVEMSADGLWKNLNS